MYKFPNRQLHIKQLRSETFSYLSSQGLSSDNVMKAPVCILNEMRSSCDYTKLQFGYRLSQLGPLHAAAPKKKGAIENQSLRNGAVCGWGSIVRQNY